MAIDQLGKAQYLPPNINQPQWKNGVDRAEGSYLRSPVQKRSVLVGHHRTSVSLEDVFWNELRAIAKNRNMHLSQLISQIDAQREHYNLSSAIRMYVFQYRASEADTHDQR